MIVLPTQRSMDWEKFSTLVENHIATYALEQYGDKGDDPITGYSAEDCIKQAEKYLKRFGKGQRPGQETLDMLKAAHYIQLAHDKMLESKAT